MRLSVEYLGEPELEFGRGVVGKHPREMLPVAGPFAGRADESVKTISLGVVSPAEEVDPILDWIHRMHGLLLSDEPNPHRFPTFPGTGQALRCRFRVDDRHIRNLDSAEWHRIQALPNQQRFHEALLLYLGGIQSLLGDLAPDCIVVCFPEDIATLRIANPKLTPGERSVLERIQAAERDDQFTLFEPTPEEQKRISELVPQAEELLFRSFYRALKAQNMMQANAVPIQVIRKHTYCTDEASQSDATRAWNLATSLYYKAGNIPWRPHDLTPHTCYVGVSFHHLKRRDGDLMYASIAQAFSNELEPFALKGAALPSNQTRGHRPYMTDEQAGNLINSIVNEYERRSGSRPARLVLHKTSRYQPEEREGFLDVGLGLVPACDLVWLAPTGFRLLRRGRVEPLRGTLCTVGSEQQFLFTTGFYPWWDEYPGPHIPAPVEIGAEPGSDIRQCSREILTLTKMNWNNTEGIGRTPITIRFARTVGMIMTEVPEDYPPNPLYRFYM